MGKFVLMDVKGRMWERGGLYLDGTMDAEEGKRKAELCSSIHFFRPNPWSGGPHGTRCKLFDICLIP